MRHLKNKLLLKVSHFLGLTEVSQNLSFIREIKLQALELFRSLIRFENGKLDPNN